MGEARRRRGAAAAAGDGPVPGRRLYSLGATLGRRLDVDEQIERIERHVEAGEVEQLMTLALVRTGVPGVFKVELGTMGATPRQAFEMIEVARGALIENFGLDPGRDRPGRAEGEG